MESLEHSGTSVDTSTEQETNLIEQPKTDMKEPDDDYGKIHVDEQPLTSDPGKDVDEQPLTSDPGKDVDEQPLTSVPGKDVEEQPLTSDPGKVETERMDADEKKESSPAASPALPENCQESPTAVEDDVGKEISSIDKESVTVHPVDSEDEQQQQQEKTLDTGETKTPSMQDTQKDSSNQDVEIVDDSRNQDVEKVDDSSSQDIASVDDSSNHGVGKEPEEEGSTEQISGEPLNSEILQDHPSDEITDSDENKIRNEEEQSNVESLGAKKSLQDKKDDVPEEVEVHGDKDPQVELEDDVETLSDVGEKEVDKIDVEIVKEVGEITPSEEIQDTPATFQKDQQDESSREELETESTEGIKAKDLVEECEEEPMEMDEENEPRTEGLKDDIEEMETEVTKSESPVLVADEDKVADSEKMDVDTEGKETSDEVVDDVIILEDETSQQENLPKSLLLADTPLDSSSKSPSVDESISKSPFPLAGEDSLSHDASSKSPISSDITGDGQTKTGSAEKRSKGASKGFSLTNIVSRLMTQVESKQEDTTETKKESGDAVVEKKSKRSEQKEQGKQMRAAAHAELMMLKDGEYVGEDEEEDDDEATSKDGKDEEKGDGDAKGMKNYAISTMDELLGLYGYDKVESDEGIELSSSLTQSKIPITGSVTKPNQKTNQGHKSPIAPGLVISNVTSIAPAQSNTDKTVKDSPVKKSNYCTECSLPVDTVSMLAIGDLNFCSQTCVDNYQSRQTKVCDYCSGLITEAASNKYVRDTQEGRKKFCSQACTEEFSKRVRHCNTCGKEISKASEGILAPAGSDGKFVDFCRQECVDNYGKNVVTPSSQGLNKLEGGQPRYWAQDTFFVCAICNQYAKAKHVISIQGKLNGLCSVDCFNQFKEKNKLQFSLCGQCSALCSNQKMMRSVEIEGKLRRFCSMRCFKMKIKRSMSTIACAACKTACSSQSMIEEWNGTELVRFFCSTSCLGKRELIPFSTSAQKVAANMQNVTLLEPKPSPKPIAKPAAKPLPQLQTTQQKPTPTAQGNTRGQSGNKCDHCSKQQRPQYHLTMSDNSIRNFCSYACVIAFQAQFNVPPVTLPQEVLQLTCSQCHRGFSNKPLPLDFKSVINVFCSQNCLDEFKRVNSVVVECDYCHLEKILHERIYFSGQARSFCSEGCKLLFKQQFAQRLGLRCTVCDYCAQTCRSKVERMYGNHKKKFCSVACKSQYDKWLSKGAKCDGCKCTGRKLAESFVWRGEMKRVCNQHCLLLFYTQQNIPNMSTQTQATIPATQYTQSATKTTTPVITNVMSLAAAPQKQQPTVLSQNSTQKAGISSYIVKKCHKQTQITTAPPKVLPPPPPPTPLPPAPKIMKNKVTLVKPYTQTKSISCRPLTATKETMTDAILPLIIPIPVPIYVPVPMHMYTLPIPHPITLPVPVPIPMFLPVAHNNADRLLETIKEIRDRIPSDPLEAELLMLADALAVDNAGSKSSQASEQGEAASTDLSALEALGGGDELSSMALEDAADMMSSQFLSENILKMAADMAQVMEEVPNNDLQDDLDSLYTVEEPKIDLPPPTTRSKAKPSGRRGRSRGNKKACLEEEPVPVEVEKPVVELKKSKEDARTSIGLNAYSHFITTKKTEMSDKPGLTWNQDILEISMDELAYILCLMCKEASQPDGSKYPPDILHLIFLSIQHYLSNSGRPDNIFTDEIYHRFTDLLHEEIKHWKINIDPLSSVILNSRINEETLWNAKQLGAHSPYILLSTLIYFNAKHFQLKTIENHKALAFCRIQKHIRKMGSGRAMFLRYYPGAGKKVGSSETGGKRKRDKDSDAEMVRLEQTENVVNPLRCPVRLYEFYLSKCPDSVRSNTDLFYLVPERSCVPDSPVWYSSAPLGQHDMNKILTRILMVTDIHDTWAEASDDLDD
ncbi:zinc finger MYM-type protein 3-like [Asterias rubens]|uniref:zinc finger MYM-type protein 3-like n=1 Tax=Asterias rubens TaxID=7604 RepID=UPI001455A91E|nr:zinc finger MYM-type protein 3-like [Asterias rubens]